MWKWYDIIARLASLGHQSLMIFCTVSWEVHKPAQSILRLVAPIRGWMAWPLVIEYFQIS
jgi:hypothetical protein